MIGIVACGIVLTISAVFILIRVVRGPSMLDRMVGIDILTTVIIAAVGLEAAWNRHTSTIPILVVLSLVGFVGSTTVARFASIEPRDEAKSQEMLYGRQRNPRRGVRFLYGKARRRSAMLQDNKHGSDRAERSEPATRSEPNPDPEARDGNGNEPIDNPGGDSK